MALFLFSCSPIKYIPENEYFLKEYKIDSENKDVLGFNIDDFVKQKPNKKIAGVYIYARVYNLVDPVKEAKREEERIPKEEAMNRARLSKGKDPKEKSHFTRWLKKIGEEPVLYSALQSRNSSKQIETLLSNKGYFLAEVTDSVKFADKKASVSYFILPGVPYKVKKFKDSINDINIRNIVHSYLKEKPVKLDVNIVADDFSKLRNSITKLLLNNGYFKFSKEYIFFEVDTLGGNYAANITMTIKDPVSLDPGGNSFETSHEQYKLDKFFIYPDYEPKDIIKKTKNIPIIQDTIPVHNNIYFLINKKNRYRASVLTQGLVIKHDSLYEEDEIQSTFKYFGSLANFRLINIDFDENFNFSDTSENRLNKLDTHIKLTPSTPQSFTVEMEGNTTSGKYGMGTNFNYQHLNIFGGAEILNIQFKVELNNQDPGIGVEARESYFSETEYGVNTSIQFPKLIIPLKMDRLYQKNFPRTRFSLGYNFRYNINYKRTIFSTSYGYNWRSGAIFSHELNPLEFNFVKLKDMSPSYLEDLFTTNQFKEKYDHVILGSYYSFTINTQDIKKNRDFLYLKSTTELAGNLLFRAHSLIKSEKLGAGDYQKDVRQIIADKGVRDSLYDQDEADRIVSNEVDVLNNTLAGFYTLFGLPYAQFFKTDIDFRYYNILNSKNELVYRINPGVIVPFGNSYYAPQEKQFFLGGASSMRAWQARTLGPGSYGLGSDTIQIYQYGDIKLEMNVEYRFKLFWMLEGALFLDAGNIWTLNEYETDDSKKFDFNKFYKEIALGTGVGFRFDLSFFVIRFDFGLKLHNPALAEGERWLNVGKFQDRDWAFNFGIGYPF
ncbi:BamA/TamA family outer membrane protein [bacterium]|nr:BamA/TamA family outer membrane protein [bacterium]